MLNSTKTWQDEFKNKITSSEIFDTEGNDMTDELKQFISDLRKQDEEELIKRLDYLDNNREEHQIIGEFKQLIKDYYEN